MKILDFFIELFVGYKIIEMSIEQRSLYRKMALIEMITESKVTSNICNVLLVKMWFKTLDLICIEMNSFLMCVVEEKHY